MNTLPIPLLLEFIKIEPVLIRAAVLCRTYVKDPKTWATLVQAAKYKRGARHYFIDMLHRDDGPAVTIFRKVFHSGMFYTDIIRKWYKYGKLHCLTGPCVERFKIYPCTLNPPQREGIYISLDQCDNLKSMIDAERAHYDTTKVAPPANISHQYHEEYRINGVLHRDGDKPALITRQSCYYYKNGLLHRDGDEPAIEVAQCGWKMWYKNGKRDRKNGPAYSCAQMVTVQTMFCQDGVLHNDKGPALIANDHAVWFIKGKKLQRMVTMSRPAVDGPRPSIIEKFNNHGFHDYGIKSGDVLDKEYDTERLNDAEYNASLWPM